jgi:hypothetical protein
MRNSQRVFETYEFDPCIGSSVWMMIEDMANKDEFPKWRVVESASDARRFYKNPILAPKIDKTLIIPVEYEVGHCFVPFLVGC